MSWSALLIGLGAGVLYSLTRAVRRNGWEHPGHFLGSVIAVALIVAGLAVLLTGCAPAGGKSNRDVEQERYQACLDAGGSYEQDDVDYSCTVPS